MYTRRVTAKEVLDHDEALSGKGLLHKVPDWLGLLNSNKRSLCMRLEAGRTKDESRFQR